MKKIVLYISAFIFIFSSCDLQRDPYNSYTDEKINADRNEAINILLNGCYGKLKAWSDEMHRVGEYPGDNIMIRGTSTDNFYDFISYSHRTDNGRLTTFWNNSYNAITQSSEVIKMIDEGESPEFDQKLGEAYYIRGLCYFYLCNAFGRPYAQSPETNMGVPILLGGIPEDFTKIEAPDRSSVKATFDQVVSDLKKAESLMTDNKSAAYASKETAQALLSRVYLYMSGTYENPNAEYARLAIQYADLVINSGRYSLLPRENFMKYNTYAPDDGSQTETIFAIKRVSSEFSGDDYYYGIGGMYANIQGMGWGEMYASAKYLDLLREAGQKNDARWAFIDPQYKLDSNGNKIPSFRFVIDLFDGGVQTGFGYVDQELKTGSDGSYYITYQGADHPLTLVNADEGQYSITIGGKTYIGEKDYIMQLNQIYPMYYITKCSLQGGESHLYSPTISRLAEMYLNKAEAYVKINDYENARQNVNAIRGRSIVGGEYTASTFTSATARELVDKERQLELAFEAQRSYDVYRNGQTMVRRYPGPHDAMIDIPATSPLVVQKIPQKEIDAYLGYGTTLTQNP